MAEVLIGSDINDQATWQTCVTPALTQIAGESPPLPPRFAFVKTAAWQQADTDTQAGFEQLAELLSDQIDVVDLPDDFDQVWDYLKTVNEVEIATYYDRIYQHGRNLISARLTRQIERGSEISAKEYLKAKQKREHLNSLLAELFLSYDALITPCAIGQAPKGIEATGDPVFCTSWNFCGVPAISLPLLQGNTGLPIGVQLIGQQFDDARLLRTANWLTDFINEVKNEQ